MQKILILVGFVTLFLIGCSTVGPFITNISSDGQGNLTIERAKVEINSFTGTITMVEPSKRTIKVFSEGKEK